jgi:hypothetical protein
VICIERVDATLSGPAVAAGHHGALRQETAPVWEMVEAVIHQGEAYAPSFYILLAVASLIGAVGILTNSTILIVGAMVVGPEYNAIVGVALGLTRRVRAEVRDGLLAPGRRTAPRSCSGRPRTGTRRAWPTVRGRLTPASSPASER